MTPDLPGSPGGSHTRDQRPPKVAGLPLLGNAIAAAHDTIHFFVRCHREYGPAFRLTYPGRTLTLLAGVEANRLFALEGSRLFSAGHTYARVSRELGTEAYPNAQDGEAHRALRVTLAPSLSALAIEPFLPRIYASVRERSRGWGPTSVSPFARAVSPLVADAVALCTTNRPVGDRLARDIDLWATMMGAVGVGGVLPEGSLYAPPVRAARSRFTRFLREALQAHREGRPGLARDPDVLDALLAASALAPHPYDDSTLLALAMVPSKNAGIYAYRLVSFVVYELLRHPEILARVQEEVSQGFAEGPPNLEGLRRMGTLQGAILEALRLHPMALALPRAVAQEFEFAGYHFAPGETVYIAGPVTHFDGAYFPDPDRFDPDRYTVARSEHRRPHVYAPFGLGNHACAARGYSLALTAGIVGGLLAASRFRLDPVGYRIRLWAVPNPIPEAKFRVRFLDPPPAPAASATAPPRVREGLSSALVDLTPEGRDRVFAGLEELSFGAGETIFNQGDPPDRFYVVRRGEVEVWIADDGAPPRRIARLGPGDHFGEIGILQNTGRTATVRAATRTTVLALGRDAFNELVVEADVTRQEMVDLMHRRAMANSLARALPGLDPAALRRLAAVMQTRVIAEGEAIVRQGDPAEAFYVLARGRVEIAVSAEDRGEITIASLEAIDFFGEAGILQGRPRNATVRAVGGPATVLEVPRERFEALVGGSNVTREDLARVAGERLLALALAEMS
jgi:CRP-like cAMP-binding protein/cytochrome P450